MIVIDDHHLFAALARRAVDQAMPDGGGPLVTTPSWYYRLARAAHDVSFVGALSRRIESLDDPPRTLVLDMLDALPEEIGLLPPRTLVPVMAKLSESVRLNHLTAEAVATAILADASLQVVVSSPILEGACERFGIALQVGSI